MALVKDYIHPTIGCRIRIFDDDVEPDVEVVKRDLNRACQPIFARLRREAEAAALEKARQAAKASP